MHSLDSNCNLKQRWRLAILQQPYRQLQYRNSSLLGLYGYVVQNALLWSTGKTYIILTIMYLYLLWNEGGGQMQLLVLAVKWGGGANAATGTCCEIRGGANAATGYCERRWSKHSKKVLSASIKLYSGAPLKVWYNFHISRHIWSRIEHPVDQYFSHVHQLVIYYWKEGTMRIAELLELNWCHYLWQNSAIIKNRNIPILLA